MKLKKFINHLKKIAKVVNNPNEINVRMADNLAVMAPILKDRTVYITDIAKNDSIDKCEN